MTDFVALSTLVFAAECFFGASLILGAAWVLARHGSAAQRHAVWLGAFAAMLILPLAAYLVPPQIIVHMPAAPAVSAADLAAPVTVNAAAPAAPSFTLADMVTLLLAVWLIGVAAVSAKTIAGLVALYRLHRRSVPHIPDGIDGEKFRAVRWQLRLRTAPGNQGPVTYGFIRQTVLLPKVSVRWPRPRLEAVLLHEFAHVRRRDPLARFVALAACAFYWPNPFVWSAAAALKRDAEIAADDMVLESGVRPSCYAETLIGLARECEPAAFAAVSMSMAERSGLNERVKSLLAAARPRRGLSRMDMLKVGASCLAITAALVLARPCLAEAQDQVARPDSGKVVAENMVRHDRPVNRVEAANGDDDATANGDDDKDDEEPPLPSEPSMPAVPPVPAMPPVPPAPPAAAMPPAPLHANAPINHIENPGAAGDMHVIDDHGTLDRDQMRRAAKEAHAAYEQDKKQRKAEYRRAVEEAKASAREARAQSREEIRQAVAAAHEAARQAREINREKIRDALATAQAERVRALEQAKVVIEKELAKAHRDAEEAARHSSED